MSASRAPLHLTYALMLFGRTARGRSGEILGLRQSVNNAVRVCGPAAFGFVASAFGLPAVFWLSALELGEGGDCSPVPGKAARMKRPANM